MQREASQFETRFIPLPRREVLSAIERLLSKRGVVLFECRAAPLKPGRFRLRLGEVARKKMVMTLQEIRVLPIPSGSEAARVSRR